MKIFIEKDINIIKEKTKKDFAYPLIWVKNNINLIEDELSYLESKKSIIANVILTQYFILKNDFFTAANYIHNFEKSNHKSIFTPLLKSSYFKSIKKYSLSLKEANKILSKNINSFSFYIFVIKLCIDSKNYNNAKKLLLNIENFKWDRYQKITLLNYNSFICHLTLEFEKSIKIKEKEIKLILELLKENKFTFNSIEPNFDSKNAFKALIDIINFFEKEGLRAFPIAGTLLGWYRDGEILQYDKDLDIGLLEKDLNLVKILIDNNPRYIKKPNNLGFSSYTTITDTLTNITIDIMIFWEDGNYLKNGWILPGKFNKYSRVLNFTPFKLIKRDWNNFKIYSIDNIELYLKEMYGDWKKDDKHFYSPLSVKNLTKNTPLITSLAYSHLTHYLNRGNLKKTKSIVLALKQFDKNNPLLEELNSYLK